MKSNGKKFWDIYFASRDGRINLKQIGCSVTDYESISADEIPNGPPAFSWVRHLLLILDFVFGHYTRALAFQFMASSAP